MTNLRCDDRWSDVEYRFIFSIHTIKNPPVKIKKPTLIGLFKPNTMHLSWV